MPRGRPATPEIDKFARFRDSETGLLVPESYRRNDPFSAGEIINSGSNPSIPTKGFNKGVQLNRDENTLAVKWYAKGSGVDDLISQAIVDGMIANAGASPVISPQLSGLVRRQQNQAITATIDVTGKETPANLAREAISRFNDSPVGVTAGLETIIYRLCTYNRGSPIATVPITFEMDEWESLGMIPHEIAGEKAASGIEKYWLDVDWTRFGTPVPFLPHPFDLEATGNEQYPYWFHATRRDGKRPWVLLHASQIIPMVPGKSGLPGVGNCPVWMCLGFLAEQILLNDERVEKLLYGLTDGIILLGGVSMIKPKDIREQIEEGRKENYDQGYSVAKGTTIITSPMNQVSTAQINLRQQPNVEFKDWREWAEDVMTFCFGEPLSAMVVRGGVGYGAQSDTAAENVAEAGIGSQLTRIATALGAIYPRVVISVTRQNDRVQKQNIELLLTFAKAVNILIVRGVLTPEQANAIIDRDIVTLPEIKDVTASANASDDQTEVKEDADTEQESASTTTEPAIDNDMSAEEKQFVLSMIFREMRLIAGDQPLPEMDEFAQLQEMGAIL